MNETTVLSRNDKLSKGENEVSNQKLNDQLNQSLANAILFYQKLRHYHWRVSGKMFFRLHEKFEELYDQWGTVSDDIAERIMAAGGAPLATLSQAVEAASIKEDSTIPADFEMVANIVADLNEQKNQMRTVIETAEKEGDRTTVNMLDSIADDSEKTLWMLNSLLKA